MQILQICFIHTDQKNFMEDLKIYSLKDYD